MTTSGGAHERITVNLTRGGSDALASCGQLIDLNRTDVVNKAVITLELLLQVQAKSGGAIYIRDGDGAEMERIRIV